MTQKPAFKQGEKTSLIPDRPGIDLEINLEEGKGLPDQKIYSLGEEELETVQEYIETNQNRGWKSFHRWRDVNYVCHEKGWHLKALCRLPSPQRI